MDIVRLAKLASFNITGTISFAGGFILLTPDDANKISLTDYTLELASKSKKSIRIERRYKKIKHKNQPRISFWVKLIASNPEI